MNPIIIGRVEDEYYLFFVGHTMNAHVVAVLSVPQLVAEKVKDTANALIDQGMSIPDCDRLLRSDGVRILDRAVRIARHEQESDGLQSSPRRYPPEWNMRILGRNE